MGMQVDGCGRMRIDLDFREWRIDLDGRELMLMDVIGCGFLRENFD